MASAICAEEGEFMKNVGPIRLTAARKGLTVLIAGTTPRVCPVALDASSTHGGSDALRPSQS